jgi:hypothetical protein
MTEAQAAVDQAWPDVFPHTFLILGTDLSGKDHVANVVADAAAAAGLQVERRRGMFSSSSDRSRSSEGKGAMALLLERLFLATLPWHCRVLPLFTILLIEYDRLRFRRPEGARLVVVSHTPIRLLAFALGHLFPHAQGVVMPAMAVSALRRLQSRTAARVVVLDIDHAVRQRRLGERSSRGTDDVFDRYMRSDAERSERIEAILVNLACKYLQATVIENNDLDRQQLLARLLVPDHSL